MILKYLSFLKDRYEKSFETNVQIRKHKKMMIENDECWDEKMNTIIKHILHEDCSTSIWGEK